MSVTQPRTKKQIVYGIVVSPAIQRTIEELMAQRREFSRSKLLRDAVSEMADRDLPSNWRETVGLDEERGAA